MLTDYTGTSVSHNIPNELIPVSQFINNKFTLSKGAFFEDGLTLTNANTGQELVKFRDYKLSVLDPVATGLSGGKAVYNVIVLSDGINFNIRVNYNWVGGPHSEQLDAIKLLLTNVESGLLGKVFYSQLKNRPTSFDVTNDHTHDASQIVGKDEEVAALSDINQSLDLLANNLVEGPESELAKFARENIAYLESLALSQFTSIVKLQTQSIKDNDLILELGNKIKLLENNHE